MEKKVKELLEKCNVVYCKRNSKEEIYKSTKTLLFFNTFSFISKRKDNILVYDKLFFRQKEIFLLETGEKIASFSKLVKTREILGERKSNTFEEIFSIFRTFFNKRISKELVDILLDFILENVIPEKLENELLKEYQNSVEGLIEENVKNKFSFIYPKSDLFFRKEFYETDLMIRKEKVKINIPMKEFFICFTDYSERIDETTENSETYNIFKNINVSVKIINQENLDDELFTHVNGEAYDICYNKVYNEGYVLFLILIQGEEKGFVLLNNFTYKYLNENEKISKIQIKIINLLIYINNYFSGKEEEKEIDFYIPKAVMEKHTGKRILERKPCAVKGHIRHYKSGLVTLVKPYLRNGIGLNYGVCVKL